MSHLLPTLMLLLAAVLPGRAWAQDTGEGEGEGERDAGPAVTGGEVIAVQTRDRAGGWRPWERRGGEALTEAWFVRAEERVPLSVGAAARVSDTVVTRQARVRIDLPDKGEITVYEDSYVKLEEWGLRHQLGGILVKVQGVFSVQYASTEALVEGTRFRVEALGPDQGVVIVEEGRVRVRNDLGEVVLEKGQQATFGSAAAPVMAKAGRLPVPRRWRPLSVGLQLGGGLGGHDGVGSVLDGGGAGEIRADVLTRLRLGSFGLTQTVGIVNSTTTSHFPVGVGGEYWLGPAAVGVQGDLLVGTQVPCDVGDPRVIVRGAGHLTAAARLPLTPALVLDGRLLAGWSAGPQAYGTVGLSWRP